jgi:hypothetical protein
MSDPYDDVPMPLGSRMAGPFSIGCFLFFIPAVALLVAIFVLRWPWWGDVLAPVGVCAWPCESTHPWPVNIPILDGLT